MKKLSFNSKVKQEGDGIIPSLDYSHLWSVNYGISRSVRTCFCCTQVLFAVEAELKGEV